MEHSKRFATIALLIVAIALTAGTLVGCQSQKTAQVAIYEVTEENSQENLTTISMFGFKADTLNLLAIEKTLNNYMDTHQDINITYESIKGQNYYEALSKRNASDNLDDVFMINHDYVLQMGDEGKLADLSDLPTIDSYNIMAKEQFTNEDGSVYFLPTCISTYNLYINEKLLAEHNIEVPTNWQEFSAACDYFTSLGITPIIANNYLSLESIVSAKGLFDLYQHENATEKIVYFNTHPEELAETLRPGFEMAKYMIDKGWVNSEELLETEQTSDDLELFSEDPRPFMITGGWASPRLMDMNDSLKYKVYPFPILEDGSVLVMDVNTCISVNSETEHMAETKEFLSYLTEADVMWNYCDSQSSFTPLNDDRTPSDTTLEPTTEYLTNGRSVVGSNYKLTLPYDTALHVACKALLQGASTDEALAVFTENLTK